MMTKLRNTEGYGVTILLDSINHLSSHAQCVAAHEIPNGNHIVLVHIPDHYPHQYAVWEYMEETKVAAKRVNGSFEPINYTVGYLESGTYCEDIGEAAAAFKHRIKKREELCI